MISAPRDWPATLDWLEQYISGAVDASIDELYAISLDALLWNRCPVGVLGPHCLGDIFNKWRPSDKRLVTQGGLFYASINFVANSTNSTAQRCWLKNARTAYAAIEKRIAELRA